jgi:hypothetical protein
VKIQTWNILAPARGWLNADEEILLNQLQGELDECATEDRPALLKAMQPNIRNIIWPACERLAQSAMDHCEGALVLAKAIGQQPTQDDTDIGDAGNEVFNVKNSAKVFNPFEVIAGTIFLS